jgi:hypothetical protein
VREIRCGVLRVLWCVCWCRCGGGVPDADAEQQVKEGGEAKRRERKRGGREGRKGEGGEHVGAGAEQRDEADSPPRRDLSLPVATQHNGLYDISLS